MDTTLAPATVAHPARRHWTLLLLAGFVGLNLRGTVLGLPPLLDRIGADLGLSHGIEGLLTSLPVLCFGVAAVPGARVVRRLGGRNTVIVGLAAAIAGTLLRSLPLGPGSGIIPLFAGTLILGIGIGIAQPAIPRVLLAWMPQSVQQASIIVTLGYIGGQLVAAGATLPILEPLLGGWRATLIFWAAPAALALAWLLTQPADPGDPRETVEPAIKTLLHSRLLWTVAVLMACANLTFFTGNSWVAAAAPGGASSRAAEIDLIVLNAAALPVALVLASLRLPFVRSRRFYTTAALATFIGGVGWLVNPDLGPLWVGLVGGGSAITFSGVVAFPATLRDAGKVAPFAALVWTVGCCGAFLGPLLGGIGIDVLHWQRAPFVPIALAGIVMLACALTLPREDQPVPHDRPPADQ